MWLDLSQIVVCVVTPHWCCLTDVALVRGHNIQFITGLVPWEGDCLIWLETEPSGGVCCDCSPCNSGELTQAIYGFCANTLYLY